MKTNHGYSSLYYSVRSLVRGAVGLVGICLFLSVLYATIFTLAVCYAY